MVFAYSKYFLVYTVQWSAIKVLSEWCNWFCVGHAHGIGRFDLEQLTYFHILNSDNGASWEWDIDFRALTRDDVEVNRHGKSTSIFNSLKPESLSLNAWSDCFISCRSSGLGVHWDGSISSFRRTLWVTVHILYLIRLGRPIHPCSISVFCCFACLKSCSEVFAYLNVRVIKSILLMMLI